MEKGVPPEAGRQEPFFKKMKQAEALDIVKQGQSVFLTGAAGSGKTHVVREYVRYLHHRKVGVAVTASTGIAATHVNGMTIHSWSGIGIRDAITKQEMERFLKRSYLKRRYTQTHVLVIDEISMLHAYQLDLVNQLCKAFRQNIQPFGGMQVIFVGDFFQLPPVSRNGARAAFATSAESWGELAPRICYLREQHRHEDVMLEEILNAMRANDVNDAMRTILYKRLHANGARDIITRLYTHNADVDAVNEQALAKINGSIKQYLMRAEGAKVLVEALKSGCLARETLRLKHGARVMFVKNNYERGYVNGTIGDVVDFDESGFPIVRTVGNRHILAVPESFTIEEQGVVKAEVVQVPLRLAWAITVHKSQGMSLDAAAMDLSNCFEPGMGYVALSRVRSLKGLHLLGIGDGAFTVHPEVLTQDAQFRVESERQRSMLAVMDTNALQAAHDAFITAHGGKIGRRVKKQRGATHADTLAMWKEGKTPRDIANLRGLKKRTIMHHIEELVRSGEIERADVRRLLTPALAEALFGIHALFRELETTKLVPVHDACAGQYSYDDLQLARMLLE